MLRAHAQVLVRRVMASTVQRCECCIRQHVQDCAQKDCQLS